MKKILFLLAFVGIVHAMENVREYWKYNEIYYNEIYWEKRVGQIKKAHRILENYRCQNCSSFIPPALWFLNPSKRCKIVGKLTNYSGEQANLKYKKRGHKLSRFGNDENPLERYIQRTIRKLNIECYKGDSKACKMTEELEEERDIINEIFSGK